MLAGCAKAGLGWNAMCYKVLGKISLVPHTYQIIYWPRERMRSRFLELSHSKLASGPKVLNRTMTCPLPLLPGKMLVCLGLTLTSFIYSFRLSVDNSEYMRNGDFLPTRLQAQQDAVNIVCHSKTRSNPENNVGLITMAK